MSLNFQPHNPRLQRTGLRLPLSRQPLCGTGRREAFVARWPPLAKRGLWRVVTSIGVRFEVLAGA